MAGPEHRQHAARGVATALLLSCALLLCACSTACNSTVPLAAGHEPKLQQPSGHNADHDGSRSQLSLAAPGSDDRSRARVADPLDALTTAQRSCGLTAENVDEGLLPFLVPGDPREEQVLQCLAARGDHQVIGGYAIALMTAEGARRRPTTNIRAYRWGMVALRNYLSGLGIDFDDDNFLDRYDALGHRPGWINLDSPYDRLYYYSAPQRDLIRARLLNAPANEIERLRRIEVQFQQRTSQQTE